MRYSIKSRKKYVKEYSFVSFARTFGDMVINMVEN